MRRLRSRRSWANSAMTWRHRRSPVDCDRRGDVAKSLSRRVDRLVGWLAVCARRLRRRLRRDPRRLGRRRGSAVRESVRNFSLRPRSGRANAAARDARAFQCRSRTRARLLPAPWLRDGQVTISLSKTALVRSRAILAAGRTVTPRDLRMAPADEALEHLVGFPPWGYFQKMISIARWCTDRSGRRSYSRYQDCVERSRHRERVMPTTLAVDRSAGLERLPDEWRSRRRGT